MNTPAGPRVEVPDIAWRTPGAGAAERLCMTLFKRPDGKLATDVAPFRQMMPFLMRTRTESAVYFEQRIRCPQRHSRVQPRDEKLKENPGARQRFYDCPRCQVG